eukprot:scaffold731_cov261-Pinguiococcus_pyrenoidosus.AAC.81
MDGCTVKIPFPPTTEYVCAFSSGLPALLCGMATRASGTPCSWTSMPPSCAMPCRPLGFFLKLQDLECHRARQI